MPKTERLPITVELDQELLADFQMMLEDKEYLTACELENINLDKFLANCMLHRLHNYEHFVSDRKMKERYDRNK